MNCKYFDIYRGNFINVNVTCKLVFISIATLRASHSRGCQFRHIFPIGRKGPGLFLVQLVGTGVVIDYERRTGRANFACYTTEIIYYKV